GIISDPRRFTPTYTKPLVRTAEGERELDRIDIKNRRPLAVDIESTVIERLTQALRASSVNAVIVADQVQERNCGVVTDRVREAIGALAMEYREVVLLADSRERIGEFRNIILKPNRSEAAHALVSGSLNTIEQCEIAGRSLARIAGRE